MAQDAAPCQALSGSLIPREDPVSQDVLEVGAGLRRRALIGHPPHPHPQRRLFSASLRCNEDLLNIKVAFLPPNRTYLLQPCNASIISQSSLQAWYFPAHFEEDGENWQFNRSYGSGQEDHPLAWRVHVCWGLELLEGGVNLKLLKQVPIEHSTQAGGGGEQAQQTAQPWH